jgi:hypothetical protein
MDMAPEKKTPTASRRTRTKKTEETESADYQNQADVICPRCMFNMGQGNKLITPSEDDKKEYVRCLLGGRVFEKEYTLYEGQLILKMVALDNTEADRLNKILKEVANHVQDNSDVTWAQTEALKVKLLFYMRKGIGKEEYEPPEFDTLEDAQAEYENRFGNVAEDVSMIFIQVLSEFTRLLALLSQSGLDQNFWKGVGLS